MDAPPNLLPTGLDAGRSPGLAYRVQGELVPALHVTLDGSVSIFFEHHVVLWKEPRLDIGMRPMKGALKRAVAGMNILITETRGPGEIAFSRDAPGHIVAFHLPPRSSMRVREHQWLAATGDLDYTYARVRGTSSLLFGGSGFFVDRFTATRREGILWLHGYGNVFEAVLGPGEQIDVEPGGWVYCDDSVSMDVKPAGMKLGLFAGKSNLVFNRFTGPGRVGIQTMYYHLPSTE